MPAPILHYVYDPLCGWCYAAAPMLDAVRSAGIDIRLHGGGLWASPTHLQSAKAAHVRQSDARIAAMTGQTFGAAYLDGLLADPGTIFWSQPTIGAVLAAGEQRAGADLDMLEAIQLAHYVEGRKVVDAATLADLARRIGLDAGSVERANDPDRTLHHIEATRSLMRRVGATGFPMFLLGTESGTERIVHEPHYGMPSAFAASIATAAMRQPA